MFIFFLEYEQAIELTLKNIIFRVESIKTPHKKMLAVTPTQYKITYGLLLKPSSENIFSNRILIIDGYIWNRYTPKVDSAK